MDWPTVAKFGFPLLAEWFRGLKRKPSPPPPVKRILLVEDDPDCATLSQRVLTGAGYLVEWVESGEHALKTLANGERFRMAFVDIGLRKMDGWTLIKQIRVARPLFPICVLTGAVENSTRIEPGVPVMFLIKSGRWEAMIDAVKMTAE